MRGFVVRAGLAALAGLMLLACASSGAEGDWVETDLEVPSERVLRQVALLALEKNGFPPGTEEEGVQNTVSSGWLVSLQPFKGDGTRLKAHVHYDETGPRQWLVGVRVERETNEEMGKTLELARAKWEPGPDDQETATRILNYMQVVLGTEFKLGPKGPLKPRSETEVPLGRDKPL
jgi:hypothetical protein